MASGAASGARGAASAEDGAAGSHARRWQAGNHVRDQPGDEDNAASSSPPAQAPPRPSPQGFTSRTETLLSFPLSPLLPCLTHTRWHGWGMCVLPPGPRCSQEMPGRGRATQRDQENLLLWEPAGRRCLPPGLKLSEQQKIGEAKYFISGASERAVKSLSGSAIISPCFTITINQLTTPAAAARFGWPHSAWKDRFVQEGLNVQQGNHHALWGRPVPTILG